MVFPSLKAVQGNSRKLLFGVERMSPVIQHGPPSSGCDTICTLMNDLLTVIERVEALIRTLFSPRTPPTVVLRTLHVNPVWRVFVNAKQELWDAGMTGKCLAR